MVEFSLISVVLIPLFMGIFSLALFMHVRNTVNMCAHEGARTGASWNNDHTAGATEARACITGALGARWSSNVSSELSGDMVVVTVRGTYPFLGWAGNSLSFQAQGHAYKEPASLGG